MRQIIKPVVEAGRTRSGILASDPSYGNNGMFMIMGPQGEALACMVSDGAGVGEGWEHVSVSCASRCPTWEEMAYVKDLFWMEEECVVQYHPPKSEYVDCCKRALHMWRHATVTIPRPPIHLLGAGPRPRTKGGG